MGLTEYIDEKNRAGEKVLSIFLTGGFPNEENFVELALKVLDAGADILEIGFPFSDPLADGPTIQYSSMKAIENGTGIHQVFNYVEEIREQTDKPIILMGYANPLLKFGYENFVTKSVSSGVQGIIVPDIPLEEYDSFFGQIPNELDIILLIAPTSPHKRIEAIDVKSRGFVYCISTRGTTGIHLIKNNENISYIKRARSLVKKNKMMVGFGISHPQDIIDISSYCDGVIVGSTIIKSIIDNPSNTMYTETLALVRSLKDACIK